MAPVIYIKYLVFQNCHRKAKVSLIVSCGKFQRIATLKYGLISVKKAYKLLSLSIHPDRVADASATRKFQIVSKLYGVLTNKEKRAIFDEKGIVADDIDENVLPVPSFELTSEHIHKCRKIFIGREMIFCVVMLALQMT